MPRLLTQAGYRVDSTAPTRSTRALFDTGDRRLAAGGGELSLDRRDGWRWRRDALGHPKLTGARVDGAGQMPRGRNCWTGRARTVAAGRSRPAPPSPSTAGVTGSAARTRRALLTLVEERVDEQTVGGCGPGCATSR